MTILAASLYRDGHRRCDFEEGRLEGPSAAGDLVWIDLADPTPDDLAILRPACGLGAPAIADLLGGTSHTMFEDHGDHWLVDIPAVVHATGATACDRMAALVGPRCIVTVGFGSRRILRPPGRGMTNGEDRPNVGAGDILFSFLSDAVAGYDDLVGALQEEVIAFGHRSLLLRSVPGTDDLAPRLRCRLGSLVDTLDRFGDLLDLVGRRVGPGSADTAHALFATQFAGLSDRVEGLALSAGSLSKVLDSAAGYREHQAAHDRQRRRAMLAAGMLTSLVVLIAIRGASSAPVGHPLGLVLGFLFFAAQIVLALCASTLLIACLKGRTRV